jgi:membrane-associated protease RseP (regulator of RpoE activity)
MNGLIAVLSFLFVIAVLIAVHEWGHYRMATLVGVRVIRFLNGRPVASRCWMVSRRRLNL